MFIRLFLFLLILAGLMWFVGKLGRGTAHDRMKYLKLAALYGAAGLLLAAILTGRLHGLFALLAGAVPWIQRAILARSAYSMFKSWQGPVQGGKPGQSSDVTTKYFDMTLDHDSGEIFGAVRRGRHKDKSLADLSIEELADLLAECRKKDGQSASVLETYLDRMRLDEWEEFVAEHGSAGRAPESSDDISREEALQILGLHEGATREEIAEAHKILMQRNHPDRGGSTWLAARINRAKDILLS